MHINFCHQFWFCNLLQGQETQLQATASYTNAHDNLTVRAKASVTTSLSRENEVSSYQEYMPLNPATKLRNWEISREYIHVIKIIGKGAFSQVAKAMAWNINGIKGSTMVAVKMLKGL